MPVRLAYGAGGLVEPVSTAVIGLQFFLYTALLGMSGTLASAAAAISLCVDSFADPLLGSLSDDTRSRWGRRVPYMLVGAPLVALGLGLTLSPPGGLGQAGLFAWLIGTSLFLRVAVSVFNVPYIALGAEVSDDYAGRSSVVAYRTLFAYLGALAVTGLTYFVFLGGREPLRNQAGYGPLAWTAGALLMAGAFVSVGGMARFAARLPQNPPDARGIWRRYPSELAEIFGNQSFRVIFFASLLFYSAQGVAGQLGNHMNVFVWKMTGPQITLAVGPYYAGLLGAFPVTSWLAHRFEKRSLLIWSLVAILLTQAILPGMRAAHIWSPTGWAAAIPIAIFALFGGLGTTVAIISVYSMMADAADEHDVLFGRRREGLYFAGLGFAAKVSSGVGMFVGGLGIDLIGFPHRLASNAAAARIPHSALDNLAWISGPVTAGASALACGLLLFYRIDKARHDQISRELAERRASAQATVGLDK